MRNRNISLKEQKFDLLDVYDMQLVQNGLEIQKKRKEQLMMLGQRMWQGGVAMDPLIAKYFADRGSSDVV